MKNLLANLKILLITIFIISGCSTLEDLTDYSTPEVISSTPKNNQAGVDNNVTIRIQFSESMNKSSVTNNLSFSVDGSPVEHYVSWSGSTTLILDPAEDLITGKRYQVEIEAAAKDKNNNKLTIPYILMFTVNPDNIQPTAIIYVQGYVGPEVVGFPYIQSTNKNPDIRINFSEAMDKNTVISALETNGMNVTYRWLDSNGNPSISPATNLSLQILLVDELQDRTKYSIMIGYKESPKDLAGNELREKQIIEFWVGNDFEIPEILRCEVTDNDAIAISLLNIFDIPHNISAKTNIVIEFSRPMNRTSVKENLKISPSVETFLSWNDDLNPTVLTIELSENVSYTFKNRYIISIDGNAKDLLGNPLIHTFNRSFVIGDELAPPKVNSISVKNTSNVDIPLLNASTTVKNIPLKPLININFSKPMDQISVRNAISFDPLIDKSKITFTWNGLSQQLQLQINETLDFGKFYTMTISNNAGDSNSNGLNKLDQNYNVSFYIGDPANTLKVDTPNITASCSTWPNDICLKPILYIPIVYANSAVIPSIDINSIRESIEIEGLSLTNNNIELSGNNVIVVDLSKEDMEPLMANNRYYATISKKIMANDLFKTPLNDETKVSFITGNSENFGIFEITMEGIIFWDQVNGKVDYYTLSNVVATEEAGKFKFNVAITFLNNYDSNSINKSTFTVNQLPADGTPTIKLGDLDPDNLSNTINLEIKNLIRVGDGTQDEILNLSFIIKGGSSGIKSSQGVPLDNSEEFIIPVIIPKN